MKVKLFLGTASPVGIEEVDGFRPELPVSLTVLNICLLKVDVSHHLHASAPEGPTTADSPGISAQNPYNPPPCRWPCLKPFVPHFFCQTLTPLWMWPLGLFDLLLPFGCFVQPGPP